MDDDDLVFKALADKTRRSILDLLLPGPLTTGDICENFKLSRYGVMKHLQVLEKAKLVTHRMDGRSRFNYINATPLREVYQRWISPYQRLWDGPLSQLKKHVEGESNE